ncbi:MAG: aminotransferase class I/II-fold pyridoxal phosphate-dependent enzyme [Clostridia bacterium]|nr:aminotransferase class I/II-fold pyridoxal phosphate-dependent enzyme [Clostridia bacterium]
MIRFNNDYRRGAVPEILNALRETNDRSFGSYGLDRPSEEAAGLIRTACASPEADVHFAVGGTQANVLVISAALRSFQRVLAADTSHIHCHETGAAEHGGHKIQVLPHRDGKLSAEQIRDAADAYRRSTIPEHITQPKLVYLSFPTEYGTLYSREELTEIRNVCLEYGLFLFVDGARMAYGLGSPENDLDLPAFASLTDAFTIGGTKCGALFGEAVVLTHPFLKEDFRSVIKQNGAMLAKGWLTGLQFAVLFRDGLYRKLGEHACRLASELRSAFLEKGIPLCPDSPTNQLFVRLRNDQAEILSKHFLFEPESNSPDGTVVVRFCTAWYTDPEDVSMLCREIRALPS